MAANTIDGVSPGAGGAASNGPPHPARWLAAALWAHRWFWLAALLALGVGGWEAGRVFIGPAVVVDVVKRGQIIETLVASGNVETPYRVDIGSQITGTVSDVLVEEGQTVAKGQELIALEDKELKAAVVQAKGAVDQAQARLRQLNELTLPSAQEALTQAQADLDDEQKTFDRTAELARTGVATRQALDDAQKALDVARAQVRAARLAVYTASPGGSDYVLAQTQRDQANATLDTATARLGYATIAAPRDGVLITRNVERGAVVAPDKTLLVLAPAGKMQLQIQVDERNLGSVALGQKAVASADAYPQRRFPAVVSYVNPGIDITRASVEVKLDVPDPPAFLRQDMTVSVDIAVAQHDDALVVPARSVRDALSDAPWVMGVRNGRAVRQPVHVGLRGDTQVEIVDGLAEGDAVIPVASGVLTGQRIRPITP